MSEIVGIGIDIVEIQRIKKAARNKAFLRRFFSRGEMDYCRGFKNKYERMAARFAAKEAVLKACGGRGVALKKICVGNDGSGKPFVDVESGEMKGLDFMVSLSHSEKYACAVAVAVRREKRKSPKK